MANFHLFNMKGSGPCLLTTQKKLSASNPCWETFICSWPPDRKFSKPPETLKLRNSESRAFMVPCFATQDQRRRAEKHEIMQMHKCSFSNGTGKLYPKWAFNRHWICSVAPVIFKIFLSCLITKASFCMWYINEVVSKVMLDPRRPM